MAVEEANSDSCVNPDTISWGINCRGESVGQSTLIGRVEGNFSELN
jgi:hypothetical protein